MKKGRVVGLFLCHRDDQNLQGLFFCYFFPPEREGGILPIANCCSCLPLLELRALKYRKQNVYRSEACQSAA